MEADVADRGSGIGGRLEGMADDGLVDVAEASLMFVEKLQGFGGLPGGMAKFDDKRIVGKARQKRCEMNNGFRSSMERKRELQEDCAEFAGLAQNIEAGTDGTLVFGSGNGS